MGPAKVLSWREHTVLVCVQPAELAAQFALKPSLPGPAL